MIPTLWLPGQASQTSQTPLFGEFPGGQNTAASSSIDVTTTTTTTTTTTLPPPFVPIPAAAIVAPPEATTDGIPGTEPTGTASESGTASHENRVDTESCKRQNTGSPAVVADVGSSNLDPDSDPTGNTGTNSEIPEADLSDIRSVVCLPTASSQTIYSTLSELRSKILSNGALAQQQVCQDSVYARIQEFVLNDSFESIVTEAGCRLLCTIAAKNPVTTEVVSRNTGVVDRLFTLVMQSAWHTKEACAECDGVHPALVPDPKAFTNNPCRVSAKGCGAMWALCALCMKTLPFQTLFCDRPEVLTATIAHLWSNNEESVSASAWLLCNAVMGAPQLSPRVLSVFGGDVAAHGVVSDALVRALAFGPNGAKGLVCWAIRALVVDNKSHQLMFWNKGVLKALHGAMHIDTPATQASAVWALGTTVNGVTEIQDGLRTIDSGAVIATVVGLLSSSSTQVQNQAAGAIYNIAARNPANQTLIGNLDACVSLINMLPKTQGSVKSVEKTIAALLCLALKHPENQQRIGRNAGFGLQAVKYLSCSSPRIQGLAAGLIRTLVAEQADLQLLFAAHGALSSLLELVESKDAFAQEQAVVALYNMLAQQPLNKSFLIPLGPQEKLAALVADSYKPTRLAYTCAIMVLFVLTEDNSMFTDKLGAIPSLVNAMLRFCHPSCGDQRLRAQADRLLKTISPADHAERPLRSPPAVLDAMIAVPVSKLGKCGENFECPICFSGEGNVLRLRCGHLFHFDCLRASMLHGKDSCPLCRDNIMVSVHSVLGSDAVLAMK